MAIAISIINKAVRGIDAKPIAVLGRGLDLRSESHVALLVPSSRPLRSTYSYLSSARLVSATAQATLHVDKSLRSRSYFPIGSGFLG
jgi:hypothetical protein